MNLPDIPEIDRAAVEAAQAHQDTLTKPRGSLGRLEEIATRIAGIQKSSKPQLVGRHAVVAAADHGVTAEGISAFPQSVTSQMVANFVAGGAGINVLAKQANVDVIVVDAGVASDLPEDDRIRKVGTARGTANFTQGPAMSRTETEEIVEAGINLGAELADNGRTAVIPGEMGIGNTTVAAAITVAITGAQPELVTGRGTGVDDASLVHKISVVERAISVNHPVSTNGLDVLSKVGGFEIGFLTGLMIGTASHRGIVVLDGYISTSAALIATLIDERVKAFLFAGHCSVEPGHSIALAHLGLEPLLDLDMRLGEGTGGVLALTVIDAALALHNRMATFDQASVSGPSRPKTSDQQ